MSALDHWISRYGLGGTAFAGVCYRPGAMLTEPFGLGNGYRLVNGLPQFGWARIHTGCDRTHGRSGDGVFVPLPCDASAIVDYQGQGYGSLIRLISQEWGYEIRIAHMHPVEDVLPEVREILELRRAVPIGTRLGRAGRYGLGTGRHTHTELVAWGAGADMMLDLAERLFKKQAFVEETDAEVLAIYRGLEHWKPATDEACLEDYRAQRAHRGIEWSSRLRHTYTDPILQRPAMRFNTWMLMGL